MLRRGLALVFLLGFTLAPLLVFGEELPHGRWWRSPQIVKKLNLQEEQIDRLEAIFVESGRKLIGLKNNVEKEQFEFSVLLDGKDIDENAVMKQLRLLDKERSALNAERVRMVLEARKVIGYDKFIILKEHMERKAKQKIRRFIGQEGHPEGKWKSKHGKMGKPDM